MLGKRFRSPKQQAAMRGRPSSFIIEKVVESDGDSGDDGNCNATPVRGVLES
jgi:hypothetical protein